MCLRYCVYLLKIIFLVLFLLLVVVVALSFLFYYAFSFLFLSLLFYFFRLYFPPSCCFILFHQNFSLPFILLPVAVISLVRVLLEREASVSSAAKWRRFPCDK